MQTHAAVQGRTHVADSVLGTACIVQPDWHAPEPATMALYSHKAAPGACAQCAV